MVNTSKTQAAPVIFSPAVDFPDLVFGLAGPIGVDLEYIQQSIADALKSFGYETERIHLTKLMDDLKPGAVNENLNVIEGYEQKIEEANILRRDFKAKDIMAALAISAIVRLRDRILERVKNKDELPRIAWIVRQLKTPEEVTLLRSVYGRQFVQVSIYGAPQKREDFLVAKIKIRSRGTINDKTAKEGAKS